MSESITSQITFSKLLSHTFPGIFLTIGIFMLIYMLLPQNGIDEETLYETILSEIFADWKKLIAAFSSLIFLGTIVGVIIDSFHHVIERKYIDKTSSAKEVHYEQEKVFRDENDKEVSIFYYFGFLPLDRFRYLTNNYYCYIECELNLSISFVLSAFIYASFLSFHDYKLIYVALIWFILIFLALCCFWVGKINYINFKKWQIDFVKGALEHNVKQTEKKQNAECPP